MYTVDFTTPIHIHFIGIGGISMSGLAEILLKEGFQISGSDAKETPLTDHLSGLGASIQLDRDHPISPTISIWSYIPLPSIRTIRNIRQPLRNRFQC